jgi:hypothetical protein
MQDGRNQKRKPAATLPRKLRAPSRCPIFCVAGLPIPLNKSLTFRDVRALQAADFAAWEIRKHHLNQNEWWELENRPTEADEALVHMMQWSEMKFGTQLPARKSLDALLESAAIEVLWDYKTLCEAHEARSGVWA